MAKKFARFFEVFFRAGTYIIWYINPISTGVLLQEQHPKKNSKKSPEDEEVQKIKFLCGVATYFTILPIPACTPDIIVYMGSISRKLVERKKKIFFYLDFKMKKKKIKNLQNTPVEIGLR